MFKNPFLLFLGMAVLLRIFSFFPSVINSDESTYIVIADSLLKGRTYWIDSIDTLPIGIFWVYALLLKIGGGSIFLLRFFTTIWISGTAYLLYRAKKAVHADESASKASGLLYVLFCSVFAQYGVSPNAALFGALFNAIALWLILAHPSKMWRMLMAGLCLGGGILIQYTAVFDALALGLIAGLPYFNSRVNIISLLRQWLLFLAGIPILPLVVFLTYRAWGLSGVLLQSVEVGFFPASPLNWSSKLLLLVDFTLKFSPIVFCFGWGLIKQTGQWRIASIWAGVLLI